MKVALSRMIKTVDDRWRPQDAVVLAAADHEVDREAAALRFVLAIAVALLLIAIASATSAWTSSWAVWVTFVACANLFQALWSMLLVRMHRHHAWTPWVLATADAVMLFGIARFGPSFEVLLPGARAALVSIWAGFVILALMSVRARAGAILYQTTLLAGNFALIVLWPPEGTMAPAEGRGELERLFDPESNAVRFVLIVMTGIVLAIGAHRSRSALKTAIRVSRERSALQRFVPEELGEYLTSNDADTLRRGRRLQVGVLFADIRNFTSLSEDLDALRVSAFLRNFRERAERAVRRNGGVIDKFIGDGLLAVFGVTEDGDPGNVLDASLAIAAEVADWNRKREAEGRRSIAIGIGAHVGQCFVGALGGEQRMEFTVIGDAVNVAQRLEEVSREQGALIVASSTAVESAGRVFREDRWQVIDSLLLRGRHSPVTAFCLRSLPPSSDVASRDDAR